MYLDAIGDSLMLQESSSTLREIASPFNLNQPRSHTISPGMFWVHESREDCCSLKVLPRLIMLRDITAMLEAWTAISFHP